MQMSRHQGWIHSKRRRCVSDGAHGSLHNCTGASASYGLTAQLLLVLIMQVMQTLKQLAEDGHTVVCSIHQVCLMPAPCDGAMRLSLHSLLLCWQPRSSIFELFDDLLLLTEGRAAYAGPAAGAVDYFAARGHPCPERYNPAEFLADLISTDTSSPDAEHTTRSADATATSCMRHIYGVCHRVSALQHQIHEQCTAHASALRVPPVLAFKHESDQTAADAI